VRLWDKQGEFRLLLHGQSWYTGSRRSASRARPYPACAFSRPGRAGLSGGDGGGCGVEAIFLPEGGSLLYDMAAMLEKRGIDKEKIRLLGTGLWDEPALSAITALHGGWYASPDPTAKSAFIARYKNAYNKTPLRIASLAYDGVSLAAILAASEKGQRYTAGQLTNPDGFDGVDGLFRLLRNGTNERALAVLELRPGGAVVVSPAPRRFNTPPSG